MLIGREAFFDGVTQGLHPMFKSIYVPGEIHAYASPNAYPFAPCARTSWPVLLKIVEFREHPKYIELGDMVA